MPGPERDLGQTDHGDKEIDWAKTRPDAIDLNDRGYQAVLRRSSDDDELVWRATGVDGMRHSAIGRAADLKSLRLRQVVEARDHLVPESPLRPPSVTIRDSAEPQPLKEKYGIREGDLTTLPENRERDREVREAVGEAMIQTDAGRRHLARNEGGARFYSGAGTTGPPGGVPQPFDTKVELGRIGEFIAGKTWLADPGPESEVDWEHQVPGVQGAGGTREDPDGFAGTLHDARKPFTVRWHCEHVHSDFMAGENCAVENQRRLIEEHKPKPPELPPDKRYIASEVWEIDLARIAQALGVPPGGRHSASVVEDGKTLRLIRHFK